jgi:hypothetical protein
MKSKATKNPSPSPPKPIEPISISISRIARDVKRRRHQRQLQFAKTSSLSHPKGDEEFNAVIKKLQFDGNPVNIEKTYDEYKINETLCYKLNLFFANHKTKNDKIKAFIERQAALQENFFFQIIAPIREGKSRVGRALVHKYCKARRMNPRYHVDPMNLALAQAMIAELASEDEEFTKDPANLLLVREIIVFPEFEGNGFIDVYITYSRDESLRIIGMMEPGSVLVEDDMQTQHGQGTGIIQDNFINVIKTVSGKRWLNIIMITPDFKFVPQIHYVFDVLFTNRLMQTTLAMLAFIRKKSTKIVYSGVVVFDVSEPAKLTRWYERISDLIKKRIQREQGSSTPRPDDILSLAKRIAKAYWELTDMFLIDYYKQSEKKMEAFAKTVIKSNLLVDAATMAYAMVRNAVGLTFGVKSIQDSSMNLPATPQPVTPATKPGQPFHFDEDIGLERLITGAKPKDKKKWEFFVMVFRENRRLGKAQDKIAVELDSAGYKNQKNKKILQRDVSNYVKAVVGGLSRLMGDDYEPVHEAELLASGRYVEVHRKGGQGEYDIIAKKADGSWDVISVKCYNTPREQRSIESKKFNPEIRMVRELRKDNKIANLIIHVYEHVDGTSNDYPQDVDHMLKWITFN